MLQSLRNSMARLRRAPKTHGQVTVPEQVVDTAAEESEEKVVVGFVDAPKAAYAVTVTGSFVQFSKEALDEEMKKQRPMNS